MRWIECRADDSGFRALPERDSLDDAPEIPLAHASLWSRLTFRWVSPLITTGYRRPLQATDLWRLDESRESAALADKFLANLDRRQARAEEWNASLDKVDAGWRRLQWDARALWSLPEKYETYGPRATRAERRATLEREWREHSGRRQGSLAWALTDTFPSFWWTGPWKLAGDLSMAFAPLFTKQIIRYAQEVEQAHSLGQPYPAVGRGVGFALGLVALRLFSITCINQWSFLAMHDGVMMRSTLVSALYKRAFELSVEGRAKMPNGKLLTMLSADISRIEGAVEFFHCMWVAPIIIVVTIIMLCMQIGASGLIGFVVFLIAIPFSTLNMKWYLSLRQKSIEWTEKRTKLLAELLGNMPVIKMFTYELPFLSQLSGYRAKEMGYLRYLLYTRSLNETITLNLPLIASVLSFVVFSRLGNKFDPALVFTALQYFNGLRPTLNQIPRSLSLCADGMNALKRMSEFFEADTRRERPEVDESLDVAVRAHATFDWPEFSVRADLDIPRGQLTAIVGPVGSGKSSLLSGLLGDMKTTGSVALGGRVGYCPQEAWIQNATIRDNILFGQPWDEDRYWKVVEKAQLRRDFDLLAARDMTEIGEKGINLSGGQKQRINIARALYFDADIILMDDPLSAVDAHVGTALFNGAILDLKRQGKTVLLVTHALHFLPQVDYIYTLDQGKVVQQGSFADMHGPFQELMQQFGGSKDKTADKVGSADIVEEKKIVAEPAPEGDGKLMTEEERKTGSVGLSVYLAYLRFGPSWIVLAAVFAAFMTGLNVLSTVWLTFWSEDKFREAGSFYQGIYAVLGLVSSICTLFTGMAMTANAVRASRGLYDGALRRVFFSPTSFFDTTPLGRVLGVFGKDVDSLDNVVPEWVRGTLLLLAGMVGSIAIISVNFPYFLAVMAGISVAYAMYALYYRRTARELKRIDSMLRSSHYAHFSESMGGMSTVRAYGEDSRFCAENARRLDIQNRAFLMTYANMIWLETRLGWLGIALVLVVALLCVFAGGRTINAAQIGMCLTFMSSISGSLQGLVHCSIEIEQSMNSVERIKHYCELPQEAAYEGGPAAWPTEGGIEFNRAVMAYRPGLPAVLKGVSLAVQPGERVGIVGRTGAGKTSITVALFRLAELMSGSITIDGVNTSTVGLRTLRAAVSIIPQDPVLFSGTLRSNLDPFEQHDDSELHDALERAGLSGRFALDANIDTGGSNLSIGERSLVSLARAFVKRAPITVLDEATAAVDLATDLKIQHAIRAECRRTKQTLLGIAHRLRTVIGWDKILVMDAGEVAEYASPLELFDAGGIFRSMCEQSDISRAEIVRAQEEDK